jgi:membrane associated rhomboid family serine protease
VSPYVTECPYCGQRVRKRAPKLDRSGGEPQPKRKARRRPTLPRLRADEIAGVAPDTRPYATVALMLVCAASALVWQADASLNVGYIIVPVVEDVWRFFVAPFLFADKIGYAFVTLVAVGIFGTLLERRFGALPVIVVFVLSGAAGMALVAYAETPPLYSDADVFRVFDLLGVYVVAIVLVLLSLAEESANIGAAVGGGLAGSLFGLVLPVFTRKSAY